MKEEIHARKPFYFWGKCRSIVEKFIPVSSSLYKFIYLNVLKFQSIGRNKRKSELSFQVHIADNCNLNCRGCSTFAPLCNNDSLTNISSFERDIEQIGKLTGGIVEELLLMGGEPLVHPDVVSFLEISRKYIKIGEITLLTNGILLLKQDEIFWKCCRDNKIKIGITPYPIKLDYERIIEIAKKYSIELEYFFVGDKTSFRKFPVNIKGNANVAKNFRKCLNSKCTTLREGKMYSCYLPSCIVFLNNYFGQDFKVSERDYIDIYTVNSKDEILDFTCKPTPFCRYCDIDAIEFGIKWGMSKKEIGEWI